VITRGVILIAEWPAEFRGLSVSRGRRRMTDLEKRSTASYLQRPCRRCPRTHTLRTRVPTRCPVARTKPPHNTPGITRQPILRVLWVGCGLITCLHRLPSLPRARGPERYYPLAGAPPRPPWAAPLPARRSPLAARGAPASPAHNISLRRLITSSVARSSVAAPSPRRRQGHGRRRPG